MYEEIIFVIIGILWGLADGMLFYTRLSPFKTYKRKHPIIMKLLTFLRDPWHAVIYLLAIAIVFLPKDYNLLDRMIFFLLLSSFKVFVMWAIKRYKHLKKETN